MNTLNNALTSLVLVALAGCTLSPTEKPVPEVPKVVRTIYLAQDDQGGGDDCSFPAANDTVYLNKQDHSCDNDVMSYVRLDNVRSSTFITLESRDCDDDPSWVFELRTTIDPISTGWLSIDALRNKKVGDVIVRGVRLTKGYSGDDNIKGKLSCVRVRVSSPPTVTP
ncbi:hypothetical protein BW686_11850 [Pseudomonas syringae]|uniref:Lipoprotein n=1 Tax=Pseudomonas syringae TaxID=317 RepID=A0A244ERE3_PSESX|nr:hypothetical protein [Pseudomonas syringae]MCI3945050.1 lipoprotein [Pseudomonas syringae]OUM07099.1 hypothetical protein BW686_11850 [Pseudomonas syringae]